MKKTTLSELLDRAKSDPVLPGLFDYVAYHLTKELSGEEGRRPVAGTNPDDSPDATTEEVKRACIVLVEELKRRGQPPSDGVVEMLEWATGLRQRKRGNQDTARLRLLAILEEVFSQYGGQEETRPPMSVRKMAIRVGVVRATIRTWREDPEYRDSVKSQGEEYRRSRGVAHKIS